MSKPMNKIVNFRNLATLAAALGGGGVVGVAQAETRIGADIGLNGGYSTNPFATANGGGAATVTASFSPTVQFNTPSSTTSLTGQVARTEYTNGYNGATDYGADLVSTHQLGPVTNLSVQGSYNSNVLNGINPAYHNSGSFDPNPNVDPNAPESFGERVRTLRGNVSLGTSISPRDELKVYIQATNSDYADVGANNQRDYDNYGTGLSWMHAVSAGTSIGVSFDAAKSNYHGTNVGDSTRLTPSLIVSTHLSPRLKLSVQGGLTFSDTDVVGGGSRKDTSPFWSASLCHEGDRSNFCLNAGRSVTPTAFTGISTLTTAGLSYNYRLDEKSEITVGAGYSKSKSLDSIATQSSDYASARLGYSRRITPRLSAVMTVGYSDSFSFSSFSNRGANFYGNVGVRYRLGDTR